MERERDKSEADLRDYRQNWREIAADPFWDVASWDELRAAVSFLTLMNKRLVLYFRGQKDHHAKCLPTLFRGFWQLGDQQFRLSPANQGHYYARLQELGGLVLRTAQRVGTPRTYILERVPNAAASVLQHYELWPTQFIDLTRSLPVAIAFAQGQKDRRKAYLYVFAMPDLRGSITSDIDQHLTLSRLEAICPPTAKRPHHQDAYLVARFPEPVDAGGPGTPSWDDWQKKTDLMRRLVAKFKLNLSGGSLPGTPAIDLNFLVPPLECDEFGRVLHDLAFPVVKKHAERLAV